MKKKNTKMTVALLKRKRGSNALYGVFCGIIAVWMEGFSNGALA
jgi:hypothetical protein